MSTSLPETDPTLPHAELLTLGAKIHCLGIKHLQDTLPAWVREQPVGTLELTVTQNLGAAVMSLTVEPIPELAICGYGTNDLEMRDLLRSSNAGEITPTNPLFLNAIFQNSHDTLDTTRHPESEAVTLYASAVDFARKALAHLFAVTGKPDGDSNAQLDGEWSYTLRIMLSPIVAVSDSTPKEALTELQEWLVKELKDEKQRLDSELDARPTTIAQNKKLLQPTVDNENTAAWMSTAFVDCLLKVKSQRIRTLRIKLSEVQSELARRQ